MRCCCQLPAHQVQGQNMLSPELQESEFVLGSVSSLIVPFQAIRPINLYV